MSAAKDGLKGLIDALSSSLPYKSQFVKELQETINLESGGHSLFEVDNKGWGPKGQVKAPIYEIGLKLSKKELPKESKYNLIPRTFLGKPSLLCGKEREATLSYRHQHADNNALTPITTIGVYEPASEPLPYGFESVTNSVTGKYSAEFVRAKGSDSNPMMLMVERAAATGVFIQQVGLTLDEDIAVLPQGAHIVKTTPSGLSADVAKKTNLVFVQNFKSILDKFKSMTNDGGALVAGAVTGAAMTSCLMSGEDHVILATIRYLGEMNSESMHPDALNTVVELVCSQGLHIAFGMDKKEGDEYMRLVGYVLAKHHKVLSVTSTMHAVIMCFKLYSMQSAQNLLEFLKNRLVTIFHNHRSRLPEQQQAAQKNNAKSNEEEGEEEEEKDSSKVSLPPIEEFSLVQAAESKDPASGAAAAAASSVAPRRHANTTTVLEGQGFANPDAGNKVLQPGTPHSSADNAKFNGATTTTTTTTAAAAANDAKTEISPQEKKDISSMCRDLVLSVASRIEREVVPSHCFDPSMSWAVEIQEFFKDPIPTKRFYDAVRGATKFITNPNNKALVAYVLALCKVATEPNRTQTAVRRRISCLRRLRDILGASARVWVNSEPMAAILKRFVSLCLARSGAVDAHKSCSPGHPSLLKEVLKCLILITHKFKAFLAPQLGTLLGDLVVPLLTGPHVSVTHKDDILSMLTRMMSTHQAAVNVYYNYDNHAKGRRLFQQIVETVAKVAEGDDGSFQNQSQEARRLQIRALGFLVKLLEVLALRCDEFKGDLAGDSVINPALLASAALSNKGASRRGRGGGVKLIIVRKFDSNDDQRGVLVSLCKRRATL